MVWLEIPGPRRTALETPQGLTQETPNGLDGLLPSGVSKPHKKGREFRKDHAAYRVRAEDGLVWGTQRHP